jgi:hypothetical protein
MGASGKRAALSKGVQVASLQAFSSATTSVGAQR